MNVDIKNAEALAEALKARLQLVISDPAKIANNILSYFLIT